MSTPRLAHVVVDELTVNSLLGTSVAQSWDAAEYDPDDIDDAEIAWYEAVEVQDEDTNAHRTVVVSNGTVVALWDEETERTYERHEYDEYEEGNSTETDEDYTLNPGALDSYYFRRLFESRDIANGPSVQYWYPCAGLDRDPIRAAALIRHTPAVVVRVCRNWGLALTGGGTNQDWGLAAAYIAVGELPPLDLAKDLPSIGSRGASDDDKVIVAACLRSLRSAAAWFTSSASQLEERAADWTRHNRTGAER